MTVWRGKDQMKLANYKELISFVFLGIIAFYSLDADAMFKALDTAATGMSAQETNVNTISNNIANINTTGFKKERAEFEDLLYETVTEAGSQSGGMARHSVGTQIGTGVKVSGTRRNFTQGSPQLTNNPYDLMINGEGFFGIILPNGEMRFTRDGSFNVDAQGNIVTRSGYRLFPGITLPPNIASVAISENGTVDVYFRDQVEPTSLGQISVFIFPNPVGLKASGGNLFAATVGSGQPQQSIAGESNAGVIMHGALEAANVNVMSEMTDLIKAQNAYQMNSKVMSTVDQMLKTVTTLR